MIDLVAERNPQYAQPRHAIRVTTATPADQLPHEPQNQPKATAISELEVYLQDMAIVQAQDRLAHELQDKVIQRIFAAGLTLQGVAGLTTDPEVRWRIEAATDDLDEVIGVVRDAVFNCPGPPGSHEPRGGR